MALSASQRKNIFKTKDFLINLCNRLLYATFSQKIDINEDVVLAIGETKSLIWLCNGVMSFFI